MRCSVSFFIFILSAASNSNAQNQNFGNPNQNFGNQNQNFANQNQNFGNPNQNFGTTHFPIYPYYEDNDLSAEQFFYFDIDLLKEMTHDQREGNILISPLSIKSVLAMILEGAVNETADELRMALHLPNNERVREQFRKLLMEFEYPKGGVKLEMANNIFISKGYTPLQSYRNIITQYYYSNITTLDFNNPVQSAQIVNNWVNEKTHGIIPKLFSEGSLGEFSILLANALYFKGMWEKAFSELGTKTGCFYLSSGECQMTPMMDVVENFKYDEVKKLDAKVIELPYSGGEYSMVVVLPNHRNGIQQLSRDIRTSINNIVQSLNKTEVFVTLPRFKIEYNVDLVNYLPKVHIQKILTPQAKLHNIVAEVSVRVSNVLHKTFMEVNEQGTEAAAVTGAVVIPLMGTTKPRFKADHPFLFFLRHTSTGTILFEGRLSIPERAYVPQQTPHQRPPQGNRQQPALQRPVQNQNYNPNFPPQQQPNNYPQNFPNQQTSFPTQQPSFSNQPISFQGQTPNVQNQQTTQFVNPANTVFEQNFGQRTQSSILKTPAALFHQIRDQVVQNIPFDRSGQIQSDDANVNDLRNDQSKTYGDSLVYEGQVNNKHRQ